MAEKTGGVAAGQLKSFVERIERLEEEKAALAEDIRSVYGEAKASGFDTKIMRQVVRLRKKDTAERQEEEALLDLYMHALGMVPSPEQGESSEPVANGEKEAASRAAQSPALRKAVANLGTPVPLTEEEKSKGVVGAFEKDGMRMSIAVPEACMKREPEWWGRARELAGRGMSDSVIGQRLGRSSGAVRYATDPEWREERQREVRDKAKAGRGG